MSSKPFPSDVLTQARSVAEAWKKIDPARSADKLDRYTLSTPYTVKVNPLSGNIARIRGSLQSLLD